MGGSGQAAGTNQSPEAEGVSPGTPSQDEPRNTLLPAEWASLAQSE